MLREADAVLITAGAGMGVDSGLPDFRGNQGFWNAYPP
ncbi:MAG TPA: Sir2 family NAD-dependent protein deacetylase, partial [Syntrophobacteraceae bacterium]|nr:Sir2 family NAD-dependent protein deacetylase [Syntrophobacteraceae bacterium]